MKEPFAKFFARHLEENDRATVSRRNFRKQFMTNCSFIHVADVHLDRPLDNVRRIDDSMAERLHQASRNSFERVVDIAIEQNVSAVVIAGDLFDGPVRDVGSGLWVEGQFKRLEAENIPVALILGNHDASSSAGRACKWGSNVHEFGAQEPSTLHIENAGLAIHGQSFGARAESEDLAAKYPTASMGSFNIGVLHTSLGGSSSSHDTYAPTTPTVLENAGYDYWALGHIHQRTLKSHSSRCYVGYSGNTQGCNIRETGAKGCQLVEIVDGKINRNEFLATDFFRWSSLILDLTRVDHLRDVEDLLESELPDLHEEADGRPLALRLTLTGNTQLHAELSRAGTHEELSQLLAQRLRQYGDFSLEAVKVRTAPDTTAPMGGIEIPVQYLSRISESIKADAIVRGEFQSCLDELLKKARHELSEYGWKLEEHDATTNADTANKSDGVSISDTAANKEPMETSAEHEQQDWELADERRDLAHYVAEAESLLVARLMGDAS